jgi:hypothetical protein
MIFTKTASLLLLLILCMYAPHARAQNQTPANIALPFGWTDPATGLTWTIQNSIKMDWNQAIAYCTNLHLGGYSDWHLPVIDELQGIYDPSIDVPGHRNGETVTWHVKGNLKLSGWIWSSTQTNVKEAWYYDFVFGHRDSNRISDFGGMRGLRALCVRR